VSLIPVLSVEASGRVIRGLALPFHSPAYVIEGDDIIEEVMDEHSLDQLPGKVPLLQGHDRIHPAIGVVRTWGVIPGKGLGWRPNWSSPTPNWTPGIAASSTD
jgi:hypothetical protein